MDETLLDSYIERYSAGELPWDEGLPPPEILEIAEILPPGRALDLGCGYGRTGIYLASKGWLVDGVDFVAQAVEEAQRRATAAGVEGKARFYQGNVTDLAFLDGTYDLAVDIGCMHRLRGHDLELYRDALVRHLHTGAVFVLFSHCSDPDDPDDDADRWMQEETIRRLFAKDFTMTGFVPGTTQIRDKPAWPSAWIYYQKA